MSKNSFRNKNRVSNSLGPDQTGHVGPDSGPNCLQRLSADDTRSSRQHLKPTSKINVGYM